ncbi:hypothetical protein Avbf_15768 [Armadillidium vulgare]|nr:hypothetical protein Avbf_15768 [Armadillidium vulgare]
MKIIALVSLLICLLVIIPTEVYGKAKPKADVTIVSIKAPSSSGYYYPYNNGFNSKRLASKTGSEVVEEMVEEPVVLLRVKKWVGGGGETSGITKVQEMAFEISRNLTHI